MGDLKPLGSEKLQGEEKIKRILELAMYNNQKKQTVKNADYITESINGVFGIVKEKDGYYVKKGLNEQSLDYIGGLFMKNKNRFTSYSEALKRLELLRGQELQEATKYVLKQKSKEQSPAPPPPSNDMPMDDMPPSDMADAPQPEMGGVDDFSSSDEAPVNDLDSTPKEKEELKRSDYMSEIQKFAGKLGQSLRDVKEKLESDDVKYTINMILSALDLKKLDKKDREEIRDRFDFEDEEEMPSSDDDTLGDMADLSGDENEEDIDETISKLERFINTPTLKSEDIAFGDEADIAPDGVSEQDMESEYEDRTHLDDGGSISWGDDDDMSDISSDDENMFGYEGDESELPDAEDDVIELDLDEIQNEINKNISATLSKYFK